MRRKRVSQGVGGDPLGNARFAHGIADLACGDTTRLSGRYASFSLPAISSNG
jgi:hypothetical protein